jgi:zinc transporter ZupT
MLSAGAALLLEGVHTSVSSCAVGLAIGVVMVVLVRRQLTSHPVDHIGHLRGAGAQRGVLIMLVMTAHSFAEGIGIGVSFADGADLGIAIAIAMAVHNVPEGLAISLVLVPQGMSVRRAAAWSVVSSLPQPLAALPAFLFVQHVSQLLPAGLGFAAGAMFALVALDIIPEALRHRSRGQITWITAAAFVAMTTFQVVLRH